MKMKLLLFPMLLSGSFALQAQEKTQSNYVRTEPNGVQVYQATGVETTLPKVEQVQTTPIAISDWDKAACESALYYIQLKQELLIGKEDAAERNIYYEEQKALINTRLKELTSLK
jgi:hypothetical protein